MNGPAQFVRQPGAARGILLPADARHCRNDEWIIADLDDFEDLQEVA